MGTSKDLFLVTKHLIDGMSVDTNQVTYAMHENLSKNDSWVQSSDMIVK